MLGSIRAQERKAGRAVRAKESVTLVAAVSLVLILSLGSCARRSLPVAGSESAVSILEASLIDGPGEMPLLAIEGPGSSTTVFVAAVHANTAFTLKQAGYPITLDVAALQDRVAVWGDGSTSFNPETIMRYAVPVLAGAGAKPAAPNEVVDGVASTRITDAVEFGEHVDLLRLAPLVGSIEGLEQHDFDPIRSDLERIGCAALVDSLDRTYEGFLQAATVVDIYSDLDVSCDLAPEVVANWPQPVGVESASLLLAKSRLARAGLVDPDEVRRLAQGMFAASGSEIVELMRPNTANDLVVAATALGVPLPESWLDAFQGLVDGRQVFVVEDPAALADTVRALRSLGNHEAVQWATEHTNWNEIGPIEMVILSQGFGRDVSSSALNSFVKADASSEALIALARATISDASVCALLRPTDIAQVRARSEKWVRHPENDLDLPQAAASSAIARACELEGDVSDLVSERLAMSLASALSSVPPGSPATIDLLLAYTVGSCLIEPGGALSAELSDAIEALPEPILADPTAVSARELMVAAASDGCGALL